MNNYRKKEEVNTQLYHKQTDFLSITRFVPLPDKIKIARFAKTPELGPKILFFSGGSALTELSRNLLDYTHNSIHIITPFDSGGSSAVLRKYFNMPAIGDIRSRIMALADRSLTANTEIAHLFSYRFSTVKNNTELKKELYAMVINEHFLVRNISRAVRNIISSYLSFFHKNLPDTFPLQGASIGNLILASSYLLMNRELDSVVHLFSQLVSAKGIVRPVSEIPAHLCVELQDGTQIIGQNKFTGKDSPPLQSPIQKIWLSSDLNSNREIEVLPSQEVLRLIKQADLICYPMGSFFSSIIANLLPKGVTQAIRENPCPKVFIPSKGFDPELIGYNENRIIKQTELLLSYLCRGKGTNIKEVLNYILIDNDIQHSPLVFSERIHNSITKVYYPLSSCQDDKKEHEKHSTENKYCEQALTNILLSLC